MNARVDLEELERRANAGTKWARDALVVGLTRDEALALVAHVRALGVALIRAAEMTEGTVSTASQHDCAEDDPDWQEAQRWRELVTRGPVLP